MCARWSRLLPATHPPKSQNLMTPLGILMVTKAGMSKGFGERARMKVSAEWHSVSPEPITLTFLPTLKHYPRLGLGH